MPAKAILKSHELDKLLRNLGRRIQERRKSLKISSVTTAESAAISRMTLNRIERGEASVTIGAYLNVVSVLGLSIELQDALVKNPYKQKSAFKFPKKIRLADYPQLKQLAWQLSDKKKITLHEALNLYERNWRHVDLNQMNTEERELLQALIATLGKGRLLV